MNWQISHWKINTSCAYIKLLDVNNDSCSRHFRKRLFFVRWLGSVQYFNAQHILHNILYILYFLEFGRKWGGGGSMAIIFSLHPHFNRIIQLLQHRSMRYELIHNFNQYHISSSAHAFVHRNNKHELYPNSVICIPYTLNWFIFLFALFYPHSLYC